MKRKLILFTSLCAVAINFSSCFTMGDQFSSSVTWIQSNTTTKTEIEKAFGPPFRNGYDNGLFTYSYGYYKYAVFSDSATKDLVVRFNADGTVHNYTFNSSFPEDKQMADAEFGKNIKK